MTADKVKAVLVDTDVERSSTKLGPLLIAGVAVYVAVTLFARTLITQPSDFTDDQWIGMPYLEILFYFGEPKSIEQLENGGAILEYEKVVVEDEHYEIQGMTIVMGPNGRVTDFTTQQIGT